MTQIVEILSALFLTEIAWGICCGRLFIKKYKRGLGIYSLFSTGKRDRPVII